MRGISDSRKQLFSCTLPSVFTGAINCARENDLDWNTREPAINTTKSNYTPVNRSKSARHNLAHTSLAGVKFLWVSKDKAIEESTIREIFHGIATVFDASSCFRRRRPKPLSESEMRNSHRLTLKNLGGKLHHRRVVMSRELRLG